MNIQPLAGSDSVPVLCWLFHRCSTLRRYSKITALLQCVCVCSVYIILSFINPLSIISCFNNFQFILLIMSHSRHLINMYFNSLTGLSDWIGRKYAIVVGGGVFLLGGAVQSASLNLWY